VSDADSVRPIGDYGLIGNCRSASLVSRDGSIDWLCWPRFDSPSLFAALLDPARGGHFAIRPTAPFRSERRYIPDTAILETTFHTADGTCVVRDLMPVADAYGSGGGIVPEHELLRDVEGLAGTVELAVSYEPRPGYGLVAPTLRTRGPFGIWCDVGHGSVILRGELPLTLVEDGRGARGTLTVRPRQRRALSLVYSGEAPAVLPPLAAAARARLDRSAGWWRNWAARCRYRGPYREAVVRSALTLKLLTYAPSGAIVAAPTTSLPERIGGDANWDYRYCWLRDASLTVRALLALGYGEEARAFSTWLLHATRLTWPELQVVYDVFGEASLPERELPHLVGYAGSRPVRIGNGAYRQFQLDVYGEVVDAAAQCAPRAGRFDRDTAGLLEGIGRTVCKRWREPDAGIWERRDEMRHHTVSKALAWVALDRLLQLHERGRIRVPVDLFRRERDAIEAAIETRAYNDRLGSYVATLDGEEIDASLLTLPLYGYADPADARMASTIARIRERLGRDALVYRSEPPGHEGTFGICAFWAVECLARSGQQDAAAHDFERVLRYANDLCLYAEEIDAVTGAQVGNFPQGFSHVGLINAAVALEACRAATVRDQTVARSEEGRGL